MNAVHITKRMTGKMTGFMSINTDPLSNDFCNAMSKLDDGPCGECYSRKTMARYKNAEAAFQRNGELLKGAMLEDWQVPRLNALTVRFSAHGELHNGTHLANLLLICRANPKTTFTLWTKRVDLVAKVLRDFDKPSNLILIRSSNQLNVVDPLPQHFDKTFTVYDKTHKGAEYINCGHKKCQDCMTCYTIGNKTHDVKEILK